jgi:hypothetical protein
MVWACGVQEGGLEGERGEVGRGGMCMGTNQKFQIFSQNFGSTLIYCEDGGGGICMQLMIVSLHSWEAHPLTLHYQ